MTVERLRAAHDVASFTCGNEELDHWLRTAALNSDRAGTARVYVDIDNTEIAGYFAIVPHQVRRADIPSSVGHGGPTTIPGFLLARLAIRRDLQGEGRGGELLVLALERILEAIAIAGGRIIVVDALDDRAAAFYRHFGFAAAALGADRLVMKASRAAATLGVEWG